MQLVLIGFIQRNYGNLIRKGPQGPDRWISDALFLLFTAVLSWLDRGQLWKLQLLTHPENIELLTGWD